MKYKSISNNLFKKSFKKHALFKAIKKRFVNTKCSAQLPIILFLLRFFSWVLTKAQNEISVEKSLKWISFL